MNEAFHRTRNLLKVWIMELPLISYTALPEIKATKPQPPEKADLLAGRQMHLGTARVWRFRGFATRHGRFHILTFHVLTPSRPALGPFPAAPLHAARDVSCTQTCITTLQLIPLACRFYSTERRLAFPTSDTPWQLFARTLKFWPWSVSASCIPLASTAPGSISRRCCPHKDRLPRSRLKPLIWDKCRCKWSKRPCSRVWKRGNRSSQRLR